MTRGQRLGSVAFAVAFATGLALSGTPSLAADFDALIRSVVATYGGPRAAAKMQAVRVEARVVALLRGKAGTVTRDFEAPDRLRVEIVYPGNTEVRLLDGQRGWRGPAGQLRPVEGLPREAMVYQLLRAEIPWVFVVHRARLVDRGLRKGSPVDYRVVGLPWSPQLDLSFWVNAVNRRVERVEAILAGPRMRTGFATTYGDWRRVEGVLFPFLEENYASGRHTGSTRLTRVVFGAENLGPFGPGR